MRPRARPRAAGARRPASAKRRRGCPRSGSPRPAGFSGRGILAVGGRRKCRPTGSRPRRRPAPAARPRGRARALRPGRRSVSRRRGRPPRPPAPRPKDRSRPPGVAGPARRGGRRRRRGPRQGRPVHRRAASPRDRDSIVPAPEAPSAPPSPRAPGPPPLRPVRRRRSSPGRWPGRRSGGRDLLVYLAKGRSRAAPGFDFQKVGVGAVRERPLRRTGTPRAPPRYFRGVPSGRRRRTALPPPCPHSARGHATAIPATGPRTGPGAAPSFRAGPRAERIRLNRRRPRDGKKSRQVSSLQLSSRQTGFRHRMNAINRPGRAPQVGGLDMVAQIHPES